jgi:hypothetical protein
MSSIRKLNGYKKIRYMSVVGFRENYTVRNQHE